MHFIETADLSTLRSHENRTGAHITLGRCGMERVSSAEDFAVCKVVFDAADIDRLYLLEDFREATRDGSCRLRDWVGPHASHNEPAGLTKGVVDLRFAADLAPLLVTAHPEQAPLIIYDGNQRMIRQWRRFRDIQNVVAFVCVHKDIGEWPSAPASAR